MTKGVLFLCTGNACRSQMAEGVARALVPPGVRIFSAGTSPKGVDARAVQVMHELGIDLSGHASKTIDDASVDEFCIEGPQFSTRAESALSKSFGADVVGMTNLPEARLAREAELCYATLALPTDYDSWRPHDEVRVTDVLAVLTANVARAKAILSSTFAALTAGDCTCQHALDDALLTRPDAIDTAARVRLHALLERRLDRDAKVVEGAA